MNPRESALPRPVAMRLAATEYHRCAEVFRSLSPAQWAMPTDCPAWDVRQLAAQSLRRYGDRMQQELHRHLADDRPGKLGSSRRSLYESDWQGAARTPLDHGPIRRNHRPDAARSIRLGWCVASGVSLSSDGRW